MHDLTHRLSLPGFVNVHSHAFQRALGGRTEGADFWAWREAMLELGRGQTPDTVCADYARIYREMRAAAYARGGLERWPEVEVDPRHASLAGIEREHVLGALVYGSGAGVFA